MSTESKLKLRKYSISEIDAMREAVRKMFPFASSPKSAEIEDQLRTHMINGTDPDELVATANERFTQSVADWQESRRIIRRMHEAERTGA